MNNQVKTIVLLGLLTALLLWVGRLIGGPSGLIVAGIFAIVINFGSYWFSDKIVLAMYRAKELKDKSHRLYKITKEIAEKAHIPIPKVYIIPSQQANAFATGRNPEHAAVAATEGVLTLLNDDELKGVMAHEISHVKNRDILISTIAGTLAGIISYIATMAQWSAIFGNRNNNSGNVVSLLILAILTPIIAMIIQLSISRSREYIADATGAKIMKSGDGLASALEKLHKDTKQNPMRMGTAATAHLFIANPFKGTGFLHLLSTHPPMEERVRRLKGMKF